MKHDLGAPRSTASAPNSFVRRLIPTIAAASLTFAACTPEEDPKTGPGNDMNTTSNNTTPDMSNTTPDMGTPQPDTGGPNPDLGTPDPDLGGDPDLGAITGEPLMFTIDGTISMAELQEFCQAWSECDTTYFQESYASVDECVTKTQGYIDESLAGYESYGADCVAAVSAQQECYAAASRCIGAEFQTPYEAYESCTAMFSDRYDMFCQ